MNKIEKAIDIIMEHEGYYYCEKCEEWIWDVDEEAHRCD